MNVKELKEKIKDLPDNMDVMLEQTNDEFPLSLLNEASAYKVTFSDATLKAKEVCLVLRDY